MARRLPVTAPRRPFRNGPLSSDYWVTENYFKTAGIPPVAGRAFEEQDKKKPSAIISANLAAKLWPGENPVGHPLKKYMAEHTCTVVGVVEAVHATSLTEEPPPMIYFPDWDMENPEMFLVVRTLGEPESLSGGIRSVVAGLEAGAAVPCIQTMKELISDLAPQRFQLVLLAGFAVRALALAPHRRDRHPHGSGIPSAAGAARYCSEWNDAGCVGITLGLLGSAALAQTIEHLLFEGGALDPIIYAGTATLLLLIAGLACLIPARRAARLSSIECRPECTP